MIIQILKEAIENTKIDKFYKQFYADKLDEETFLKLVGLDLSSYMGNNFNNPLGNVGQLASAVILPDYVGNGKSYIDANLDNIKKATEKFILHRNDFDIKNPKAFTSVESFVKYILDGVTPTDVKQDIKPAKKELTPDEKLEQLRKQQMPNIPNLDIFKEICSLDIDSNLDSGQPGDVARGLLLPYYNRSLSGKYNYPEGKSALDDQEFLKQKKRTKMAIIAYYNKKDMKVSDFETIQDFLNYYTPLGVNSESNVIKVLKTFLVEGTDYEIVGRTTQHDVIWEKTKYAAWVCEYPQTTVERYREWYARRGSRVSYPHDANTEGRRIVYAFADEDKRATEPGGNAWCTGWSSSMFNNYAGSNTNLYAILVNSGNTAEIGNNFQISLRSNGSIVDIETGYNAHLDSTDTKWRKVKNQIFKADPQLVAVMLNIPEFAKNGEVQDYISTNNIQQSSDLGLGTVYVDAEPFVYHSHADIQEYLNKHDGDLESINLIDTLIIADGVKEIPAFEFENWFGLIEIKFPDSLEKIGARAFHNCSNIQRIRKFNDGLKEIAMGAFEGCNNLKGSILLPNSIEKLGTYSFKDCKVTFRLKTSIKNIPGKQILVPTYPEDEKIWWRTNGRIIIAD